MVEAVECFHYLTRALRFFALFCKFGLVSFRAFIISDFSTHRKNLATYKVTYSVNPDHINIQQLQSIPLPATDAQAARISQHITVPNAETHSFDNHSLRQESSPNNFESITSQSSDEEAVARELLKMMEQSDYYEESLTKGNSLNIPREPPMTNGIASSHLMGQSGTRDSRLSNSEDVSPVLERGSLFIPGEASSPEERLGNGNPYPNESPGKGIKL